MQLIPSFQVDHTTLMPGIYVSRTDMAGDVIITTYDVRMTMPNREPAIDQKAMHTLEHLVATFFRNEPSIKDEVIYVGPMGCHTGMYVILQKEHTIEEVRQLVIKAMQFVADFEGEVPGTTPESCGNYLLHDLTLAKKEAARYKERLQVK